MKKYFLLASLTLFSLLMIQPAFSQSWVKQQSVPNVVHDIAFADSLTGYMAGEYGVVYKSTDGGAHWSNVLNLGSNYYWYGMHVFSTQKIVVGGFTYKNNPSGYSIMRWTTNGGTTWTNDLVIDTTSLHWIMGVDFVDSLHGLAIGNAGQVYITSNGGLQVSDWTQVQADTSKGQFMGNFTMHPDGKYYISGSAFCNSDDYGASWTRHPSADTSYDIGASFPDSIHGWTGGGNDLFGPSTGWVYRTKDGGNTWNGSILTPPYPIYSIYFFDTLNGFAVGGNMYSAEIVGGIWSTTDGGDNWINELNSGDDSLAMQVMTRLQKTSSTIDMWAVGSSPNNGFYSTVYKKSDVSTALQPEESSAFNLHQNYPNPFSSATTINYSLPKAATVDLTVYDLLGREVARLVNSEFKQAGNYAVEFKVNTTVSSNVCYFYTFKAGDIVSTRRMLLLKQ